MTSRAAPAARGQQPIFPVEAGSLRRTVVIAATLFLVFMALATLWDLRYLTLIMGAGMLLCMGTVVIHAPIATSVAWLLVAGTTPEMWLGDLLPGGESALTALVKLAGLGLVVICIFRYGLRIDWFNPGIAYVFMFVFGLVHGLWPTLTVSSSLRSLIGSAAPFAFSFSRLSRRWCDAIINAVIWVSPFIVCFGVLLAAAGLKPLFGTVGGLRLQASTHPAFLGNFAQTGVYAALLEFYRGGRNRNLYALVLNFLILGASGARAPLAYALVVTSLAFFFLPSQHFPLARRFSWVFAGATMLPLLVAIGASTTSIRLIDTISSSQASNLSNRDVIWPYFQEAWDASPWFGWGVGAGKEVINPDGLVAHLLGTTAAHNEYLRIGVDGGYVGLGLLITFLTLWCLRWTWGAPRLEKVILRLVFICFALHSITDNTLIAATASILFTWVSAVFARIALEREHSASHSQVPGAATA